MISSKKLTAGLLRGFSNPHPVRAPLSLPLDPPPIIIHPAYPIPVPSPPNSNHPLNPHEPGWRIKICEKVYIYILLLNEQKLCIYIYIYLYHVSILKTALLILIKPTLSREVWTLTKLILIDLFLIKVIIDR